MKLLATIAVSMLRVALAQPAPIKIGVNISTSGPAASLGIPPRTLLAWLKTRSIAVVGLGGAVCSSSSLTMPPIPLMQCLMFGGWSPKIRSWL
jgi:hypothetical protein